MKRFLLFIGVTALGVSASIWRTPVFAQGTASDDQNSSQLTEIVVQAQRRGQDIQDVPISVTAFSNAALANTAVTNALGLTNLDPSLQITTGTAVNSPFIRGVGNPSATEVGNEASVPVYIDDVYYSRLNVAYLELADIDHVEVLKGPQGTLFGRNSSGGAMQYFTRNPGTSPEFETQVGYANYNTITGKVYAAGPITDGLAAGLSISGRKQNDGWGTNVNNGDPTYTQDFVNIHGKVVANPTSSTKITLSAFYAYQNGGVGNYNTILAGTVSGTPSLYGPPQPVTATRSFYDSNDFFNPNVTTHGWGASIKLEQDVNFAEFVSISAYRQGNELDTALGNVGNHDYTTYHLDQYDRETTEELQLKSKSGSAIDWIVGGFYMFAKSGYYPGLVTGDVINAAGLDSESLLGLQTIKSFAGYTQATAPIVTADSHITLGLRYTSDNVHGWGATDITAGGQTFPAGAPYVDTVPFHKLTFRAALDHKFLEDLLGYLSYSRGYKSGTFNTLPLDTAPTQPETVDAYELGFKSQFLDNRVRFNAAIFENKIKDPQVQTIINSGGANFVGLTNAQDARVQGAEFNAEAKVTSNFGARLGATFLDAIFTSFTDAPFYYPVIGSPYGLQAPVLGNANGNPLPQVPKWRITAGLNYDLKTVSGGYNFDLNAAYTDRFAWNPDNIQHQASYTMVNSTITYTPVQYPRWKVRVWGQNLIGVKYYTTELENQGSEGYLASPGAPRTFGIDFGFKY
jgi:iron complex outermembrane receptor protein